MASAGVTTVHSAAFVSARLLKPQRAVAATIAAAQLPLSRVASTKPSVPQSLSEATGELFVISNFSASSCVTSSGLLLLWIIYSMNASQVHCAPQVASE